MRPNTIDSLSFSDTNTAADATPAAAGHSITNSVAQPSGTNTNAIVETQIASGQPPITGQTIDRLMKDGLRRHPAIHMVMHALAQQLVLAGQGSSPEPGHWERTLSGLKAGDAVGEALRGRLVAPEDNDPSNGNRAQRRAAQKAKRRNKPTES